MQGTEQAAWAGEQGYSRYLAASLKGNAEIDWNEPTAREAFLAAAQLLGPLGHQEVARPAVGVRLKKGVSRDRTVSVHYPEMRHERKSHSQRLDGHKAAVAVDPAPRGPH